MVNDRSAWLSALVVLVVSCCGAAPGCGGSQRVPSRPATAPVTGIVRLPDGSPLPRGFVQLEVVDGPHTTISAVVEAGRFSLSTTFDDATIPGVVPGRYRFVVVPEFSREPKTFRFEEAYDFDTRGGEVTLDLPAN